jgi:hypothetical protein
VGKTQIQPYLVEAIANINVDLAVGLMGGIVAQLEPWVKKKLMAKLLIRNLCAKAGC